MSRTVIDLDDELVAEVARALGTRTKKDTVNTALREVLENRRRAVALTRLREAAAEGAFDLGCWTTSGTTGGDRGAVPDRHQRAGPADAAGRRILRLGPGRRGGPDRGVPGHRAGVLLSARSAADRERGIADFRSLFGWVPVHDRAFARAWEVQGELTRRASTGARARWTSWSPRPRNCTA